MIPQNMKMHRVSRELLLKLESLAKQNNITTMVTLGEIYQCDQLVMKYYINPVLSVIENKLRHIGKKTSKHFSIQYWVTIIETTLGNNMSVQRADGFMGMIDRNSPPMSYQIMMNYLPPCDYGDSVATAMIELSRKYSDAEILRAINIGKGNNIYSIHYVKAVIEKEQALSNINRQKIEDLASKAESAVCVLDRGKVDNTVMDIASAVYNWNKAKEDAELIDQFNKMFGGDNNG